MSVLNNIGNLIIQPHHASLKEAWEEYERTGQGWFLHRIEAAKYYPHCSTVEVTSVPSGAEYWYNKFAKENEDFCYNGINYHFTKNDSDGYTAIFHSDGSSSMWLPPTNSMGTIKPIVVAIRSTLEPTTCPE